jgi:hypothetical protein
MTDSNGPTPNDMVDRRQIHECILRYCRGLDRRDRELVLSAFHPDAVDDHGHFVGPIAKFVDWVFSIQEMAYQRTQHLITNHLCEIDGDTAHTESYYASVGLPKNGQGQTTTWGRYIDRLEKRDGRWAVVARVCLIDIRDRKADPDGSKPDAPNLAPLHSRDDPSYMRPLVVDPARFTV